MNILNEILSVMMSSPQQFKSGLYELSMIKLFREIFAISTSIIQVKTYPHIKMYQSKHYVATLMHVQAHGYQGTRFTSFA